MVSFKKAPTGTNQARVDFEFPSQYVPVTTEINVVTPNTDASIKVEFDNDAQSWSIYSLVVNEYKLVARLHVDNNDIMSNEWNTFGWEGSNNNKESGGNDWS